MAVDFKNLETNKLLALAKTGGYVFSLTEALYHELCLRNPGKVLFSAIPEEPNKAEKAAYELLRQICITKMPITEYSEELDTLINRIYNAYLEKASWCMTSDQEEEVLCALAGIKNAQLLGENHCLGTLIQKLTAHVRRGNAVDSLCGIVKNPVFGVDYVAATVETLTKSELDMYCPDFAGLKDGLLSIANSEYDALCAMDYFHRIFKEWSPRLSKDFQEMLMNFYNKEFNEYLLGDNSKIVDFPDGTAVPTIYWNNGWVLTVSNNRISVNIPQLIGMIDRISSEAFKHIPVWVTLESSIYKNINLKEVLETLKNITPGRLDEDALFRDYLDMIFVVRADDEEVCNILINEKTYLVLLNSSLSSHVMKNFKSVLACLDFSSVEKFKAFWRDCEPFVKSCANHSVIINIYEKLADNLPDIINEISEYISDNYVGTGNYRISPNVVLHNTMVIAYYWKILYVAAL